MVMTALRQRIKIIILITLVAFVGLIFFDWGMQKSGGGSSNPQVIGRVNGRDITRTAYQRYRQNVLDDFEARTGRPAEVADLDALEEDVWLGLVREMLLREQIEKYGIVVTDAEIVELLQTSPPSFVRSVPDFQDEEGSFDATRYSQALANPAYEGFWIQVENVIRSSAPMDKIQNYVGLGTRVTTAEVRRRFLERNEKVRVRYVARTSASVDPGEGTVPEADLREWYEQNPEDYRAGQQAVLEMVRVSKAPSAADSADTRADLEDIREAILEGADFAKEAEDWSDDSSAERGGDLGFFGRGDMVHEFDQVAFALDPGQVSEVVETQFGYHLLKIEGRKTEDGEDQVHARHILLRVEPSRATLRAAEDRMDDFLAEIEEGTDFHAAARSAGLEVETTPPFARGAPIGGIGILRPAHRFAFGQEPGAVSRTPVEDDASIYAFRLKELREAGLQAFDDVEDRVRTAVLEEKRRTAARAELERALEASDGSLDRVARELGVTPDTTAAFARQDFVPGVGRRNAFVATAFALAEGETSGLVEADRGFYVLEVLSRIPADEEQLETETPAIRAQLLTQKKDALIQGWMEELLGTARVLDFRGGGESEWSPEAFGYYAASST